MLNLCLQFFYVKIYFFNYLLRGEFINDLLRGEFNSGFTCSNGKTVPIDRFCDGSDDCDGSDELYTSSSSSTNDNTKTRFDENKVLDMCEVVIIFLGALFI